MKNSNVVSWLRKGWTKLVDPQREPRLTEFVRQIHKLLSSQRQSFDFQGAADDLQIPAEDREEVAERLFKKCLERAWSDSDLSESELRSLKWIAVRLGYDDKTSRRMMVHRAIEEFERILANAFADGVVDDSERQALSHVAAACGSTPAALIQAHFQEEGEGFIRNLFLACWRDGQFDSKEWNLIQSSLTFLGMSLTQFRDAIYPQAKQVIEHCFADFQSDGDISGDEERLIEWMLSNLISDDEFEAYVRAQLSETKLFAAIARGKLPSLSPPRGMALRAGEIVHFIGPVDHWYIRRKGGSNTSELVSGDCAITDDRLIFVSPESSFQVIHSKVLGYSATRRGFELQCSGKGAGTYDFKAASRLANAIWKSAIAKANQTLVFQSGEAPSRHIPRDVRQRVWQKYGGRCAECSADQYLEYDHIVPVAKGGSNSENNVQLLCRKCNLSKSDNI